MPNHIRLHEFEEYPYRLHPLDVSYLQGNYAKIVEVNPGEIYRELGATPVINAIGSVTMLGGSTPFPEVKEAMERAGDAYVSLMDLEEKAGNAIAAMVDVPAAYVTSGAGSAIKSASC